MDAMKYGSSQLILKQARKLKAYFEVEKSGAPF